LPPAGSSREDVEAFLDASPFIESDDPAIVGTARAIVGDERDRYARRSGSWTGSEQPHQEPSLTIPSARAVLAARTGDCNEHAVLLTALARAPGIPARGRCRRVYADARSSTTPGASSGSAVG
jgi:transglutaminase-like putative cysteine protease